MFYSSAVIVPKQDSFVAGNGQVEHASLRKKEHRAMYDWQTFQNKKSLSKYKSDIKGVHMVTFEI